MDTKSAGIGSHGNAVEPANHVAEEVPGGHPAPAALDGAACTPDASPGSAPPSSSDRRAGAAGAVPTPAPSRMTPEAALRSALGLCDYLLRHWAGPEDAGSLPSVASTRDDVIAGLLACEARDYGAPPRATLLAETHARLRALAAAHGSTCLQIAIWDHEPWGERPWSRRLEWSSTIFEQGSCKNVLVQDRSESHEELLTRLAAALAIYDLPDPAADVVALGELPECSCGGRGYHNAGCPSVAT